MSDSPCYVFDTNVLVSALLFEGSKPDRAFRLALKAGRVLLSLPVLEELSEVMSRVKFERYVSAEEREEFLEALIDRAGLIEPDEQIEVCRDSRDNKFLELAVGGGASCIISGDEDLLVLHPFRGIAILTVEDFLRQHEL